MADNITTIKDPTIYIKPGETLIKYLQENGSGLLQNNNNNNNNNNTKVPENIRKIVKKKKNINLTKADLDWLNQFLTDKRNINESDLLTGQELNDEIDKIINRDFSSFNALDFINEKKNNLPYLHDLMEGSEFILPENEVLERNPVLAERIEKLKRTQEEREYKAMTRNVETSKKHYPEDSISYQVNMMNRHLIAVGQLLVSVGAGFAFGFLGIELIVGDLQFSVRLILGIACALIIGLAEFYFLAKNLNEEDKIQETNTKSPQTSRQPKTKVKAHKD